MHLPRTPLLIAVIGAAGLLTSCSGPASPAAPAGGALPAAVTQPTFGSFPTFLPTGTLDAGAAHSIVTASSTDPALASQGDTVRVNLAGGSVLATVTGPEVPNEGLPLQAPTSPATFTLTFSHAHGVIPLRASAFNAVDDEGRIYALSPPAGSVVPASVRPGQTISFKLYAVIETGEGRLRWIPSGHLAPVEWDYVVEDD